MNRLEEIKELRRQAEELNRKANELEILVAFTAQSPCSNSSFKAKINHDGAVMINIWNPGSSSGSYTLSKNEMIEFCEKYFSLIGYREGVVQ